MDRSVGHPFLPKIYCHTTQIVISPNRVNWASNDKVSDKDIVLISILIKTNNHLILVAFCLIIKQSLITTFCTETDRVFANRFLNFSKPVSRKRLCPHRSTPKGNRWMSQMSQMNQTGSIAVYLFAKWLPGCRAKAFSTSINHKSRKSASN